MDSEEGTSILFLMVPVALLWMTYLYVDSQID